jgi:hypothetical protein
MKKLFLVIALLAATAAQAQWRHEHRYWEPPRTVVVERNDWVAPLIIGGIAGAIIANQNQPQPVVVQREQVIVPQPQTVCTAWKEILQPDGQIYRERNCYQR